MADHSLDRQPGIDRLADDINTLKQQLSELRTLQLQGSNAINIQTSSPALGNVWTSVANGAICTGTFTLASNATPPAPMFGVPFVTFYEGSYSLGNNIGHGNARDAGYTFRSWLDWENQDGTNLVCNVEIINNTGGTIPTIQCICKWRYVVSSNTASDHA